MFSRSVVEGVVEDCGDAVKMSRVKGLKREVIIIIKARTWDLWRGDWGGRILMNVLGPHRSPLVDIVVAFACFYM